MKRFIPLLLPLIFTAVTLRADPLNEDEAYDPSDWFDGNNYEYDDTLDLDLGPGYAYQHNLGENTWYDTEITDRNGFERADAGYEAQNASDYGWHYDWKQRENEWVADYGWHTSKYDYSPNDAKRSSAVPSTTNARNSRPPLAQRAVYGTIEQVKTLRLRDRTGTSRAHSVARLTMEDGRSILVDLGEKRPHSFQLNDGDKVTIKGRSGRINGRRVLLATSARVDGRQFTINRAARNRSAQTRKQTVTVAGRVQDVAPLSLNNESGETQRFLNIAFEDGRGCLVDLGSVRLQGIGLTEGEQVSVRGERDQISGREFIRADQITINGKTTNVEANPKS